MNGYLLNRDILFCMLNLKEYFLFPKRCILTLIFLEKNVFHFLTFGKRQSLKNTSLLYWRHDEWQLTMDLSVGIQQEMVGLWQTRKHVPSLKRNSLFNSNQFCHVECESKEVNFKRNQKLDLYLITSNYRVLEFWDPGSQTMISWLCFCLD